MRPQVIRNEIIEIGVRAGRTPLLRSLAYETLAKIITSVYNASDSMKARPMISPS